MSCSVTEWHSEPVDAGWPLTPAPVVSASAAVHSGGVPDLLHTPTITCTQTDHLYDRGQIKDFVTFFMAMDK